MTKNLLLLLQQTFQLWLCTSTALNTPFSLQVACWTHTLFIEVSAGKVFGLFFRPSPFQHHRFLSLYFDAPP